MAAVPIYADARSYPNANESSISGEGKTGTTRKRRMARKLFSKQMQQQDASDHAAGPSRPHESLSLLWGGSFGTRII